MKEKELQRNNDLDKTKDRFQILTGHDGCRSRAEQRSDRSAQCQLPHHMPVNITPFPMPESTAERSRDDDCQAGAEGRVDY